MHWEKFYISRNSRTKQFFTLQAKKFARWSPKWPLNKVLIFSCFEQIRPPPNLKKAGFNKKVEFNIYMAKYKRFKKIAWIWSHHLHLQWKFKLWVGKVVWGLKAKHCLAQQCFAFTPQANFPTHNLNFHWRWRWWDQIQAIFLCVWSMAIWVVEFSNGEYKIRKIFS